MKKITTLVVLLLVGTIGFAQDKAIEQPKKKSPFEIWPELKEFQGNLEPIKSRATEMKEKAAKLADSKIPADLNNEKVVAAVTKLKDNSVIMEKMIADKKTDKEISDYLIVMHDTFHEIIGLCRDENH